MSACANNAISCLTLLLTSWTKYSRLLVKIAMAFHFEPKALMLGEWLATTRLISISQTDPDSIIPDPGTV